MNPVKVYLPKPDTYASSQIDKGSGIVGREVDPGETPFVLLLLYFEGNRFGAVNMRWYAERVMHAHGRMDKHYPTIAKLTAPAADVVHIGWYDTDEQRVSVIRGQEHELLRAWLDVDEIDEKELQVPSR